MGEGWAAPRYLGGRSTRIPSVFSAEDPAPVGWHPPSADTSNTPHCETFRSAASRCVRSFSAKNAKETSNDAEIPERTAAQT